MKTLLRSTFRVDPTDDPTLFLRNAQSLIDSGLGFDIDEDAALWAWIQDFIAEYHHVPDSRTIREHFETVNQMTVVDRLDSLSMERPRTQGDFLKMMGARQEDRRLRLTTEILKDAAQIASGGITVKERGKDVHLRGPSQALRYVVERASDVVAPVTGVRLSGIANADGDSFLREYERVEKDPLAGYGQLTGIEQIDEVLKGAKRKELWTHAAFTGGLKSTFAVNWIYNQAVFYRHSSVMVSLEMPYEQVRRMLYAIHSAHPKFKKIRIKLGVKKSLEYEDIKNGELSEKHKKFMVEHVIPDFNDLDNKYGHIHIEVADPNKSDFNPSDLKSKLELAFSKDPAIRLCIIDHAGLMQSRNKYSGTTERLNEVLRDLKRLAMSFNGGLGIAMVALFQISREGFRSAEKNGGRYNLTHLSYANEAERSSDVVTASWVDEDLEDQNLVKFQCLKTRDSGKFKDFFAGVLWKCRRLFTTKDVTMSEARETGKEIDLDI